MANRLTRLEPEEPDRLYGRLIAGPHFPPPAMFSKATTTFALIAWLATAAFAFMLGRASVKPEVRVAIQSPRVPQVAERPAIEAPARPRMAVASQPAEPNKASAYPRIVSTIPSEFRGAWDEIVTDKCFGREARYTLEGTTLANFEVVANVERVKLVSPTEVEISVTGYDSNKDQFNDTIGFRLLDGGNTITGTQAESNFYRRCPKV